MEAGSVSNLVRPLEPSVQPQDLIRDQRRLLRKATIMSTSLSPTVSNIESSKAFSVVKEAVNKLKKIQMEEAKMLKAEQLAQRATLDREATEGLKAIFTEMKQAISKIIVAHSTTERRTTTCNVEGIQSIPDLESHATQDLKNEALKQIDQKTLQKNIQALEVSYLQKAISFRYYVLKKRNSLAMTQFEKQQTVIQLHANQTYELEKKTLKKMNGTKAEFEHIAVKRSKTEKQNQLAFALDLANLGNQASEEEVKQNESHATIIQILNLVHMRGMVHLEIQHQQKTSKISDFYRITLLEVKLSHNQATAEEIDIEKSKQQETRQHNKARLKEQIEAFDLEISELESSLRVQEKPLLNWFHNRSQDR